MDRCIPVVVIKELSETEKTNPKVCKDTKCATFEPVE